MSHADEATREAFEQAVYRGDLLARYEAAGRVWRCTDVMPASLCDALGLPRGKSYAAGARLVRDGYRPDMSAAEAADVIVLNAQRYLQTLVRMGAITEWHRDEGGAFVVTFSEPLQAWIRRSEGESAERGADMAASVLDGLERMNTLIRQLQGERTEGAAP